MWSELIEEWKLIVVDFRRVYSLDIEDNMHRPFRWFATYVAGLLSIPDTLLSNRFTKDEQPTIGDQS